VTGIFDSIDRDGNLVLITGTGPRAIPAADIFFS
jgi:BirA family biotin operon repressor/biotin-[acetyl-CoA-carboxylase] ligase